MRAESPQIPLFRRKPRQCRLRGKTRTIVQTSLSRGPDFPTTTRIEAGSVSQKVQIRKAVHPFSATDSLQQRICRWVSPTSMRRLHLNQKRWSTGTVQTAVWLKQSVPDVRKQDSTPQNSVCQRSTTYQCAAINKFEEKAEEGST